MFQNSSKTVEIKKCLFKQTFVVDTVWFVQLYNGQQCPKIIICLKTKYDYDNCQPSFLRFFVLKHFKGNYTAKAHTALLVQDHTNFWGTINGKIMSDVSLILITHLNYFNF